MGVMCGTSPGNLGSVLRHCPLLDVAAVCVLGGLSRSLLRKSLRTSQVERFPDRGVAVVLPPDSHSPSAALAELKEVGLTLVGLTAEPERRDGTQVLWECDVSQPRLGIVLGADRDDQEPFPEGVVEQLNAVTTIPMRSAGG